MRADIEDEFIWLYVFFSAIANAFQGFYKSPQWEIAALEELFGFPLGVLLTSVCEIPSLNTICAGIARIFHEKVIENVNMEVLFLHVLTTVDEKCRSGGVIF